MSTPIARSHLLYIPTHRECVAVMDREIQELRWLGKHDIKALLCVLDNSTDPRVAEHNRRFLHQRRPKETLAAFLGQEEQRHLVDVLIANAASDSGLAVETTRRLLLPEGISYGRGPNLAALIGAALGAAAIHRRDSDEYQDAERYVEFPVELEVAAIGRQLSEVAPTPRGDPNKFTSPIAMVGTSMFGRPPIDRRDLFAAGEHFETCFQQLGRPGVPMSNVRKEAHQYLQVEPTLRYDEDFYDLSAPDRVEMGQACAAERLYTALPEMPGGIIGTDYMQRDLAYTLAWPILFHSRKVQHIYDGVRDAASDEATHISYVIRDVQYIQVGRIWQQHTKQVEQGWYGLIDTGGEFVPGNYAASFAAAAEVSQQALVEIREGALGVYRDAAQGASGDLKRRLSKAAEAIANAGSAIDDSVLEAVADFCALVRSWPHLVAAARHSQSEVRDLFGDS